MTDDMVTLRGLLEKSSEADPLREIGRVVPVALTVAVGVDDQGRLE